MKDAVRSLLNDFSRKWLRSVRNNMGTMQKPPRWCPWISTAKSDLDSFLSARNRSCNHFPSKHIWGKDSIKKKYETTWQHPPMNLTCYLLNRLRGMYKMKESKFSLLITKRYLPLSTVNRKIKRRKIEMKARWFIMQLNATRSHNFSSTQFLFYACFATTASELRPSLRRAKQMNCCFANSFAGRIAFYRLINERPVECS